MKQRKPETPEERAERIGPRAFQAQLQELVSALIASGVRIPPDIKRFRYQKPPEEDLPIKQAIEKYFKQMGLRK